MTPKELFAIIDKRWRWVSKNENGTVFVHETKPQLFTPKFDGGGKSIYISSLIPTIDFGTDDWTKCIARRDEIDMDEVLAVFDTVHREQNFNAAIIAAVEYVRNQLEQE